MEERFPGSVEAALDKKARKIEAADQFVKVEKIDHVGGISRVVLGPRNTDEPLTFTLSAKNKKAGDKMRQAFDYGGQLLLSSTEAKMISKSPTFSGEHWKLETVSKDSSNGAIQFELVNGSGPSWRISGHWSTGSIGARFESNEECCPLKVVVLLPLGGGPCKIDFKLDFTFWKGEDLRVLPHLLDLQNWAKLSSLEGDVRVTLYKRGVAIGSSSVLEQAYGPFTGELSSFLETVVQLQTICMKSNTPMLFESFEAIANNAEDIFLLYNLAHSGTVERVFEGQRKSITLNLFEGDKGEFEKSLGKKDRYRFKLNSVKFDICGSAFYLRDVWCELSDSSFCLMEGEHGKLQEMDSVELKGYFEGDKGASERYFIVSETGRQILTVKPALEVSKEDEAEF